jgi:hypothetical protein
MTEKILEQVIVGAAVTVSVVYLAVRAYKSVFKKEPGCGSCAGCPSRSGCGDAAADKAGDCKQQGSTRHE